MRISDWSSDVCSSDLRGCDRQQTGRSRRNRRLIALVEARKRRLQCGALSATLTYIITEPCIRIKDASCVDVCPVDRSEASRDGKQCVSTCSTRGEKDH